MKIDRLIGILAVLQQCGKVTAPYLAERFEVSRRTISRDIEDICKAGIPIVTTQGADGGIALMEGFALDTTVFTRQELSAILTGLKSLDSVSHESRAARLLQKLGGQAAELADDIQIDLASFYKNDLAAKIEAIRAAIRERRCIRFRYYYDKGEADKYIEPHRILFRWSDWYVYGYCRQREDFRMYKLRRLWELSITEDSFTPRPLPEEKTQYGAHMTDDQRVTAIYEGSEKYRLVEEYGPHSFTVMEDGRLLTEWGFTSLDYAERWFLSFGERVTVTAPPEMVERMRQAVRKTFEKYSET